jgi:hypothetical protein
VQDREVGGLEALSGVSEHIVRHYYRYSTSKRRLRRAKSLRGNTGPSLVLQAESKIGISRLCNDQLFPETEESRVVGKGCWLQQMKGNMRKRGPWIQKKNYEENVGDVKVES